jgi:hypothetical protein
LPSSEGVDTVVADPVDQPLRLPLGGVPSGPGDVIRFERIRGLKASREVVICPG